MERLFCGNPGKLFRSEGMRARIRLRHVSPSVGDRTAPQAVKSQLRRDAGRSLALESCSTITPSGQIRVKSVVRLHIGRRTGRSSFRSSQD
jgi:hypothetical protein